MGDSAKVEWGFISCFTNVVGGIIIVDGGFINVVGSAITVVGGIIIVDGGIITVVGGIITVVGGSIIVVGGFTSGVSGILQLLLSSSKLKPSLHEEHFCSLTFSEYP